VVVTGMAKITNSIRGTANEVMENEGGRQTKLKLKLNSGASVSE
jgi:hypothetical protein